MSWCPSTTIDIETYMRHEYTLSHSADDTCFTTLSNVLPTTKNKRQILFLLWKNIPTSSQKVYFERFFSSLLVRDETSSADLLLYRVDAGNRLPLCAVLLIVDNIFLSITLPTMSMVWSCSEPTIVLFPLCLLVCLRACLTVCLRVCLTVSGVWFRVCLTVDRACNRV